MKKLMCIVIMVLTAAGIFGTGTANAEQTGTPVIATTNPMEYFVAELCHGGAGSLRYMSLLGEGEKQVFETNLLFVHRGVMLPKSGLGEHVHRFMEEMYITFDGNVRHTVNGHTSELPPGSMALCQMGSSHGMYNDTDKEVNYINIGVTKVKGKYDNVDFNDNLVDAIVESPAKFEWANFDRRLLKPANKAHLGKGAILFRRLWGKESFLTNWEFIDHCVLPPGTSIGYHQHNGIEEVYYLMSGSGRMTVNDVTRDVKAGDAIPCTLHDSHGLYNNSDKDIEILVIAVSMEKGVHRVTNWGDDLSGR
ncbi:cupin domain-containing protein [Candidatus Latescibacterota bacterium]